MRRTTQAEKPREYHYAWVSGRGEEKRSDFDNMGCFGSRA